MDRYLSVALRQIEAISGGIVHAIEFVQRVDARLAAIEAATAAINEKESTIMALDQSIVDEIAVISGHVDNLAAALSTAVTNVQSALDAETGKDNADQATIATLTQTVADLQAAAAGSAATAVTALDALDQHITAINSGGTPAPAPAPTPAPVDPNAPPAVAPAPADQTGQLADLTGHGSTDAPAPDAGVGATTPPDTTAATPAGTDPAAAL